MRGCLDVVAGRLGVMTTQSTAQRGRRGRCRLVVYLYLVNELHMLEQIVRVAKRLGANVTVERVLFIFIWFGYCFCFCLGGRNGTM